MPKNNSCMTEREWRELPITFGSSALARLTGTNRRYIQNHPSEFGGVLVAGKWLFSKPAVAELLGLGGTEAAHD